MDVTDQPLFSTIITVHNGAKLISATLDSVLLQQGAEQEVLVVDCGSTDGTEQVLADYGRRITVLRQDDGGPGAARNLALEQARGQYIASIDSNDLWLPWTLATYRQVIEQYDRPALVTADEWSASGSGTSGNLSGLYQASLRATAYDDYLSSGAEGGPVPLCATVVRADMLRCVGGFSDQHVDFEDTDLWLRLGTAGGFLRIDAPFCSARREQAVNAAADLPRRVEGVRNLIEQVTAGRYPGGIPRRRQLLVMLSAHVCPVSIQCLRQGRIADAWFLYRRSFRWHVRLGRVRYLLGFVRAALAAMCKRR